MKVYKYCYSEWGLKILQTLEVKLTSPNHCNDPFEFRPHIICTNEVERIMNYSDEELKDLHGRSLSKLSFEEFKKEARTHGSELYKGLANAHEGAMPITQRQIQDAISKECAILCLSKKYDSIPMWGYYCGDHRGLVIGFDEAHILFQPPMRPRLSTVDYVRSHERVVFDTAWSRNSLEQKAFDHRIIYWKNEDWIHEAELRQIFKINWLKPKLLADGTQAFFLPIPEEAIVSVLLGMNCPDCIQDAVASTLSQPQLSHVNLYKAGLHESKFEMIFTPVRL